MGNGTYWTCPKCGIRNEFYFGVGIMFPRTYARTKEALINGTYGQHYVEFFREHPDGAIDVYRKACVCKECGIYERYEGVELYLPKEKIDEIEEKSIWSIAFPGKDISYVDPWELHNNYVLYERSDQMCPECNKPMDILNNTSEFIAMTTEHRPNCKKCGAEIRKVKCGLNWD